MEILFLIVIGTSIWVLFDAKSLGFGKRQLQKGRVDAGPWIWFLGCLFLWIVAFPFYLVKRSRYRQPDAKPEIASIPAPSTLSESISQLERLGRLKDKGLISEEEFAAKKRVILLSA